MAIPKFLPCAALLMGVAAPAFAQQPAIPPMIHIIVPVSPGASNDNLARLIAPKLAARLGTNVIVENRAGASGFIGTSAVAKGPKDGSMLLIFSTSLISAAATMSKPTVDVIKDIQPVAGLMEIPLVVVASAKGDIKSPADLLSVARSKPSGITHANGSPGGVAHFTSELLADAGNFRLTNVNYKGGAPALLDVATGIVDIAVSTHSPVAPLVKAGRIRLVAVGSREPSPNFPELQTLNSVIPGFERNLWIGAWTTAGTPSALVQRYNQELAEIVKSKEIQDQAAFEDGRVIAWTPDEFAAKIRQSYDEFKKVAAEKHLVAEQ